MEARTGERRRRRWRAGRFGLALAVLASGLLASVGTSGAALTVPAGVLDPSFDGDGLALNGLVNRLDEVSDVERLPDGNVLVLADGHLWRFSADGILDPSFGSGGVLAPASLVQYEASELALRPDGGFALASGGAFIAACPTGYVSLLGADGAPDTGFGGGGTVCIDAPDFQGAGIRDLTVQPDGQVVVLGAIQSPGAGAHIGLVRLDGSGATTNVVAQPLTSTFEHGEELAVQPDGAIVVLGATNTFPNFTQVGAVLTRYDGATLTPDLSFGSGGHAAASFGLDSSRAPLHLALAPVDGIAVAAVGLVGTESPAVEARLFDRNGVARPAPAAVTFNPATFAGIDDLTSTATGYVATGHVQDGDDAAFAVRFDGAGTSSSPLVVAPTGAELRFGSGGATLLADGKVLSISVLTGAGGEQFALQRIVESPGGMSDLSLDTSLGSAYGVLGLLAVDAFTRDRGDAVVVQPDGRAIVGGYTSTADGGPAGQAGGAGFVLRHAVDGSLDPTFGSSGRPGVSFLTFPAEGLALTGNGRVVAAGGRQVPGDPGFGAGFAQRLLASGEPDPTWNGGAPTVVGSLAERVAFHDVAVQADGRAVAVGEVVDGCLEEAGCTTSIVVARFDTDGSLDETFGTAGTARIGPSGAATGRGVAVQVDGRIVVTGAVDEKLVLARLTPAGAPDAGFDADGVVVDQLDAAGGIGREVVVRTSGDVVVAGDARVTTCPSPVACITTPRAVAVTYGPTGARQPGAITTILDAPSEAHGLSLDGAGNAVVAGQVRSEGTGTDVLVARVLPAGGLDVSFAGGRTITHASGEDIGRAVAIGTDGKIVVAGASATARGEVVLSARYGAGRGVTQLVLDPLLVEIGPRLRVLLQPSGTLRDGDGDPIAGRKVLFTSRDGVPFCSAVTGPTGRAGCGSVISYAGVASIVQLGYAGSFAGDDVFEATSGSGGLVRITIRLF